MRVWTAKKKKVRKADGFLGDGKFTRSALFLQSSFFAFAGLGPGGTRTHAPLVNPLLGYAHAHAISAMERPAACKPDPTPGRPPIAPHLAGAACVRLVDQSAPSPPRFKVAVDARGGAGTGNYSALSLKRPREGEKSGGSGTPALALSAWGLPPAVVAAYHHAGVASLYPWQAAALACGADGASLVVAAPTSGGKSLVAEVLLLRRLLATAGAPPPATPHHPAWKKAMVILPYAALVVEKAAHLATVLAPIGLGVRGYAGGSGSSATPLSARGEAVAVLTIEKANACVDALAKSGRLGELVAVVVDEAHMLADPGRGAVLEVLLSKLRFARPTAVEAAASAAFGSGLSPDHHRASPGLQVVAMSATMAGLPSICTWLRARLFLTDTRATPLSEAACVGGHVFPVTPHGLAPEPSRSILGGGGAPGAASARFRDPDRLAPLVAEAVAMGEPTLIFCASRAGAAATAALLGAHLPALVGGARAAPFPSPAEAAGWAAAVADLTTATGGTADPALLASLAAGVAFHHAGLTAEERGCVEAAFRGGRVLALAATSTLAAGVNLPAARVIIRSVTGGGGHPLPRAQYLQMVGRAGRAGLAARGEAFLMARPAERAAAAALATAPLPAVSSQLVPLPPRRGPPPDGSAAAQPPPPNPTHLADPPLERLFLEAVAGGLAGSPADLGALLGSTLAAAQLPPGGGLGALGVAAKDALASLRARRLLSYSSSAPAAAPATTADVTAATAPPPPQPVTWATTQKGRAVHAAGLPARAGEALFDALADTLGRGIPLDSPVALVFGVLPDGSAAGGRPALAIRDWRAWGRRLGRLAPPTAAAAAVLGITAAHADAKARLGLEDPATDARHARFLTACAAADLMDEVGAGAIARRWGPPTQGGGGETAPVAAGVAPADAPGAPPPPPPPITPGDLQRLRDDVAQRLAMGAAVAGGAGWALAAVPLGRLADRAAAGGGRPELLPLLAAIPGLAAPAARALHSAGLTTPHKVARAVEGRVARALLSTVRLPREEQLAQQAQGAAGAGRGAWAHWAAGEAARVTGAARKYMAAAAAVGAVAAHVAAGGGQDGGWVTTPNGGGVW